MLLPYPTRSMSGALSNRFPEERKSCRTTTNPMKYPIILIALLGSPLVHGESCLKVQANVAHRVSSSPAIEFVLTNACTFDVRIYPMALPWGSPWSVGMDAVALRPPKLGLEKLGPLYHNFHEDVVLAKGSHLSGTVSMTGWFVDFLKINRKSAIAVHWYYTFPEELNMGWISGVVTFPKASVDVHAGKP